MEDEPKNILSPLLSKPQIQKQIDVLKAVVDQAQKRVDYTIANNPDIIKAIECVERFLRKKKRVCYGGQAINALLPKGRQFYDMKYTIPDYDFFSPTMTQDVEELISDLEKDGFEDISKKLSVHEGTIKVYVNFVPVADCSQLNPDMFSIVQKRANVVSGILYADPDFLRMMMYLELSRPRGEVERWKKVYERLVLLNHEYPLQGCDEDITTFKSSVDPEDRKFLLDFCVKRKLVLAGPECVDLLEKNKSRTHLESLAKRGGPVICFSSQPKIDGEDIADILRNIHQRRKSSIKVEETISESDHVFNYVAVMRGKTKVALLFQEDSCHAYTTLKVDSGSEMRIGTPDLLLHLYYSLMIFGKKEKMFFQLSLNCLVRKLYAIAENARSNPTEFVPAFGLRCSGHQRGIATLLKLKAERTETEKKKIHNKGNSKNKRRSTRKVVS
jgi:hypothetical protein